jgi:hypothetical protein
MTNLHSAKIRNFGAWFYFEVGGHQITVFGSGITGREKVWVDDDLVVNMLSWSFQSDHKVDIGGVEHIVRFGIANYLAGEVYAEILLGDKTLHNSTLKFQFEKAGIWTNLISLALGAVAGYFIAKTLGDFFGF